VAVASRGRGCGERKGASAGAGGGVVATVFGMKKVPRAPWVISSCGKDALVRHENIFNRLTTFMELLDLTLHPEP